MVTPYPALLFVDPLTVPGAKVRLEGQKLGLLLEEAKPGRRAFSFRARSCAPRAQTTHCGSWAVPRSRGPEWARAWGRRMDGSRGWDPRGGAQREHPRAVMYPRGASPPKSLGWVHPSSPAPAESGPQDAVTHRAAVFLQRHQLAPDVDCLEVVEVLLRLHAGRGP